MKQRLIAAIATAAAELSQAAAQSTLPVLLEMSGTAPLEQFGWKGFEALRDVDGDGVCDFAATGRISSTGNLPHVTAYSGATGQPIWRVSPQINIWFAHAMYGGGDVDGDGKFDLLVLSFFDGPTGSTWVLSGEDGSLIRKHYGAGVGSGMQAPGAIVGDTNGDGFDDYLICDNQGQLSGGTPFLINGRDGTQLYAVAGNAAGAPWSCPLGDVDGDGHADFVIQPGLNGLTAFSGRTGSVLFNVTSSPSAPSGIFSSSDSGGGDLNGDGVGDFVASRAGSFLKAYSGVNGSVLWTVSWTYPQALEHACITNDWDGDGLVDVVAGGTGQQMNLLSGLNGSLIAVQQSPSPQLQLGEYPRPIEDMNGDGVREVLSLAYRGTNHPGSVVVTSHGVGPAAYRSEFGSGCPSSNGHLPRARLEPNPRLGTTVTVSMSGGTPGALPILLAGTELPIAARFEWTPGCLLLVQPWNFVFPGPVSALGRATVSVTIPANPSLAGAQLGFQWAIVDQAANATGVVGSTGMRVMLGP
jgi:hypothetical protein